MGSVQSPSHSLVNRDKSRPSFSVVYQDRILAAGDSMPPERGPRPTASGVRKKDFLNQTLELQGVFIFSCSVLDSSYVVGIPWFPCKILEPVSRINIVYIHCKILFVDCNFSGIVMQGSAFFWHPTALEPGASVRKGRLELALLPEIRAILDKKWRPQRGHPPPSFVLVGFGFFFIAGFFLYSERCKIISQNFPSFFLRTFIAMACLATVSHKN